MAKKKGGKKRPQARAGRQPVPVEKKGPAVEPPEEEAKADADASPASDDDSPPSGAADDGEPPSKADAPEAEAEDEPPADSKPEPRPKAAKPAPKVDLPTPHAGAEWGKPIRWLDDRWTWLESRLLVGVMISLIISLIVWVSLKGMKEPLTSESVAGMVFRGFVGMFALASVSRLITSKAGLDETKRNIATAVAGAIGIALAPMWRKVGVQYFEQIFNWLQEGSSLTMFGGLRGVSTRLTILLAMIGASLAASTGKHINIDVVLRFMRPQLRVPVFAMSTVATIVVCVAAAWGFFDYISVQGYGAKREWSRDEKIAHTTDVIGDDLFVWRQQIGLDLSAMVHVGGGGKWDEEGRMNGRQWNAFVENAGYRDHYTKEQVDALLAPQEQLDESRIPMVIVPDDSPRGLLVNAMNMTFPIGLILVAIRFFLKMLLVLSGHAGVEAEGEPEGDAGGKV